MLLKTLINPKPSIILFFSVFCILFVFIPLIQFETTTIFNHSNLHPLIVLLIAIAAPFFLSTGLNNIIYEKNVIRKENIVISYVFILISSPFVNIVEAWVSSFALLFLFNFLIDSYQKDLPFSQFYNASIILGGLSFVYSNLIFLALLLIISGINYSNLNWRIIITILFGLLTPYLFYFVFVFLTETDFQIPTFNLLQINLSIGEALHISKKIWIGILSVIILVSFIELFMWLYKKSIKSRRTFMTIIWFFVITLLIALYSNWEYFYFTLIPLSIIIGNYFVYTKNRLLANSLFLLLIISSLYYKYMIGFNV